MKKLAALASMAALLCASTTFAKKALDEEEMELVTAAGQPAVIVVDNSGGDFNTIDIMADEMGLITQTVDTGSQTNLRAMAINNVAGENQVANAINIRSGAGSTGPTASQSNEINQSWGSTFDWSFAPGTATAGAGGSVSIAGSIDNVKINCVAVGAGTACNGDVATGGDGGSAEIPHLALSAYADKIIGVTDLGSSNTVNISQMNMATVTQSILENSQSTLAALAINNVAGQNQVATGINVTSRGGTFLGNSNGVPLIAIDSTIAGGSGYAGDQSNLINQYRGTPLSRPCANCPVVDLLPPPAAPAP